MSVYGIVLVWCQNLRETRFCKTSGMVGVWWQYLRKIKQVEPTYLPQGVPTYPIRDPTYPIREPHIMKTYISINQ